MLATRKFFLFITPADRQRTDSRTSKFYV